MLLGVWENLEHLETVLSLDELNAIVNAGRDRDMRHWKFQASLKGINLDDSNSNDTKEQEETGEEALARIKRRAALKASGINEETKLSREVDKMELFDVGLDFVEG